MTPSLTSRPTTRWPADVLAVVTSTGGFVINSRCHGTPVDPQTWSVVAAVPDARALLREVALTLPHAAVVDIRIQPTHTDEGIPAARQIRRLHPGVAVLVLSQYLESTYAMRLVQDEPDFLGYLLKERVVDVSVLVGALERLVAGERVIDPAIVNRLLRRPRDPGRWRP